LQQLIDEANQSLEEAGTPQHEVSVVILHREFAGGSLGITLAGGADYETKEITVWVQVILFYILWHFLTLNCIECYRFIKY
jgi:hypothetical protein